VTGTSPMWFYCGQIGHCQEGMVGVINEPAYGNTLRVFEANAKRTNDTINPRVVEGGALVEVVGVTSSVESTEVLTLESTAVSTGVSTMITTTDGVVTTVVVGVTGGETVVVSTLVPVAGGAGVNDMAPWWVVSLTFSYILGK
jgi:hypothetical protein